MEEDLSSMVGNGTMLRALVTMREYTSEHGYDEPIRGLVAGRRRVAITNGDYAFYPDAGIGEAFNYP